jgi:hypothetical protein
MGDANIDPKAMVIGTSSDGVVFNHLLHPVGLRVLNFLTSLGILCFFQIFVLLEQLFHVEEVQIIWNEEYMIRIL